MDPNEAKFSAAVLGKRCVRLRTAATVWTEDTASPHFSLYFELEGGETVRAIFDLDKFFVGTGTSALPTRPDRVTFRLSEPASLRPFFGRLINHVEFEVAPGGDKKLHVYFDPIGQIAFWNTAQSSQMAVTVPNDT